MFNNRSKKSNKSVGDVGEELAVQYLLSRDYTILSRNYATAIGELDIVATDGAGLVFVEVKTRFSEDYGAPSEAVDHNKINTIKNVASQYINQYCMHGLDVRFDIIEVYERERKIRHLINAFDSFLNAKSIEVKI